MYSLTSNISEDNGFDEPDKITEEVLIGYPEKLKELDISSKVPRVSNDCIAQHLYHCSNCCVVK